MENYETVDKSGLTLIRSSMLNKFDGLIHTFSTRVGGVSRLPHDSLNLSYKVEDTEENVSENRRRLAAALGHDPEDWATISQVHGNDVVVAGRSGACGEADAMITKEPGVFLAVSVADCVPIMLYDPVKQAVGLVHAGWRGTLAKAVMSALLTMSENFGTDLPDVHAVIGPSIGPCCYGVGEDVRDQFIKTFPYHGALFSTETFRAPRLDLALANRYQLRDMLVRDENIHTTGLCTSCRSDLFFSHRRDQGKTGRMMAVIGITK